MSDDAETGRRDYRAPYTSHHPVPTVQHYREEKEQRRTDAGYGEEKVPSRTEQTVEAAKDYWYNDGSGEDGNGPSDGRPYESGNQNVSHNNDARSDAEQQQGTQHKGEQERPNGGMHKDHNEKNNQVMEDTSQASSGGQDPKQKRKSMKKRKDEAAEREVTDPVTHLPVTIHDFTDKDLKETPENEPSPGSTARAATGSSNAPKSNSTLRDERRENERGRAGMERLFPPPAFDSARTELVRIYQLALTVGLGLVGTVVMLLFVVEKILGFGRTLSAILVLVVGLGLGLVVIRGLQGWVANKVKEVWEDEVWDAERQKGDETANSPTPESTQWLNSVLASIWPLVNPDLFTSLADTLEDVMQASLPKLVRMVSVEDIGQGSESLRILGIRWLPTGAAAQSVSVDGTIQSDSNDNKKSDRSVPGEGEVKGSTDENAAEGQQQSAPNNAQDEQEGEAIAEGLEAEDGDFMNLEVAFAYRARSSTRRFKDRAKNAHLYLAFYLPGSVKLPVWVELRGLVSTIRLRLQLTPDPPFFALCTLTFLGQPKVDLSCVPLVKRGLNIMDLPLISNFVQSAVDAAMAEYVAPKSLTLDLKNMLVGDDFKKDTDARGVLIIRIKRAYDFKEGDSGMLLVKQGSADPYVTISWAKFGKPLWSTRVILSEMEPCWDETAFVLVTPEALNVDERLRVQLWDSDRTTADDDLGRVELGLKGLMRDPHSDGKMWDRTDSLKALKAGEGMPGKIEWSVGYFSKVKILESQLAQQTNDPSVKNTEQLKQKVHEESEKKLREANKDKSDEVEQQKAQDFKARQDQFAMSSPPPEGYPSGILSIQIHQITGLEIGKNNKDRDDKADGASDEEETGESLPSAYCTIILNQQKIFKTRTKPKNSKPFFNAGTERFVRDWRQTEVMISVRDARVHEDDALLGVIYLPLGKIFAERSQINGNYPLAGGIGYGRCRVSVVFRSVQLQAPKELLGWDWGTLEISPQAHSSDLAHDLQGLRIKLRTSLQRGKMHYVKEGNDAKWASRHDRPIHLAVRKRYCSSLVVEFRSRSALLDKTPAFAVLWLKDIPDNEEKTVTLTVWKGDLKRAETRCVQECGQKAGTIELKVTFWSGLSGYHSKLASKDRNLADVMEVLDTANDSEMKEEADDRSGSSSDSSDSSDDDDDNHGKRLFKKSASYGSSNGGGGGKKADSSDDELATSGKRGPIETFKDFRKHNKQLNRRHRGLMQWKGARTIKWAKHKLEHGEQHVSNLFRHNERDTGIETEV